MRQPSSIVCFAACVTCAVLFPGPGSAPVQAQEFRRGDANADGRFDISDPIFTLNWLFSGGQSPSCLDAVDADDSGDVVITDAVHGVNHQFLGGPPPLAPFPDCGADPTPDDLGACDYPPDLCRTPLSVEGDPPGVDDYAFGSGGDLNDDDAVDDDDEALLVAALEGRGESWPEYDANQDGVLDEADLLFLREVIGGKRPTLLFADFFEDDVSTGEPAFLEVEGVNLDAEMVVRFGGTEWFPDEFEAPGGPARVFFEVPELLPQDDTLVRVETELGTTLPLTAAVVAQAIGDNDESSEVPDILLQEGSGIPAGELGARRGNCCITKIVFRGRTSGLRIFAFDDSGNPARKNGPVLKRTKTTTLTGEALTVSIIVVEKRAPLTTFKFTCDTIRTGVFVLRAPEATDANGTRVRPRELFEIVDFSTKRPCTPKGLSVPTNLRGGVIRRDNADWNKPRPHVGSGALAKFTVPDSSIAAAGCNAACWSQQVSTSIEIYDTDSGGWKTLFKSKLHNDNNDAESENGKPWYCYGAASEENDPREGKRQVLGDGPHMIHARRIWIGGKRIDLKKGDLLRRKSVFVTQLICYDPLPERVLASMLWSITTVYTHDPDNLRRGGETVVAPPVIVNYPRVPTKKDRKTLRKYLKKKERDRKKCK